MVSIRKAKRDEIQIIVHHRIEMLRSMGWSVEQIEATREATLRFLNNDWDPSMDCYFAVEDDRVVGGCAVSYCMAYPTGMNPSGKFALLYNMYVEPENRRTGIATALLRYVTQCCREKGVEKMTLHDTKMSKGIYEREGFVRSENYYIKFIEL